MAEDAEEAALGKLFLDGSDAGAGSEVHCLGFAVVVGELGVPGGKCLVAVLALAGLDDAFADEGSNLLALCSGLLGDAS